MQIIKKYIQQKGLEHAHANNNRAIEMTNFNLIKTIGLLSNPQTSDQINQIDEVVKHFQNFGKQIFPLVYSDKQIENETFTKNIDWSALGKNDCSWIGKPKNNINLNLFINKEFDLLIDFSFSSVFCLQYIFIQSKARLKIMPNSDFSRKYADLMLDTPKLSGKLDFAKELIHYLEIINKNQK